MMTKRNLAPDAAEGSTPPSAPSTGDVIGQDINAVGEVVGPIVTSLDPPMGKAVTLAFRALAIAEPVVYNAIAALLRKEPLTAEQEAAIADFETRLDDPDSYLK